MFSYLVIDLSDMTSDEEDAAADSVKIESDNVDTLKIESTSDSSESLNKTNENISRVQI